MLKDVKPNQASSLLLREGQIVSGQILKIFPDQTTLVKMGQFNVHARLEAPLVIGQRAWFQVQSVAQPTILKVLPIQRHDAASEPHSVQQLMRLLGLESNRRNEQIVRFFMQENLPMTRSLMQNVQSYFKETNVTPQQLQSIHVAISKGWPVTPSTIQAIHHFVYGQPLLQQLETLVPQLPHSFQQPLLTMMQQLTSDPLSNARQMIHFLKVLGIEHEHQLSAQQLIKGNDTNLKHALLHILNHPQLSAKQKWSIQALIYSITGQQLFMQMETNQAPFVNILQQWPFLNNEHTSTVYGSIQGKKKQKSLDSDNCRMVFYVQLKALNELCVDVHVLKKYVSITIYNDHLPEQWVHSAAQQLKLKLSESGYTLSQMNKKPIQALKGSHIQDSQKEHYDYLHSSYKGVDIRI